MTDSTPGPWFYEYYNDTGPDDDYFLEFHKIKNTGLIRRVVGEARNASDARLMAAAPDLLGALEALERIKDIWLPDVAEDQHQEEMIVLHKARTIMLAAIAKAKGK